MTTYANSCKANSVFIGSWEITSSLNKLYAQTGQNEYYRKDIAISVLPRLKLDTQVIIERTPTHGTFETLLEVSQDEIDENSMYGIKLLYADAETAIEIYDTYGNMLGSDYTVVSDEQLVQHLHIVFKYSPEKIPSSVVCNLYNEGTDVDSGNGGSLVEAKTFGFLASR